MQTHSPALSPQKSNLPPAAASVERAQRRIGPVDMEVTTRADAVRDILHAVRQRQPRVFAFCNMHTFNVARRSPEVAAALGLATVYNDGIGIDIASRILHGTSFPENLNGTDLTPALLTAFDRPVAVYVLGGLPGVAVQAGAALAARFSNVRIVGTHDGYFSAADNNRIADAIRQAHTELVLVGMGNPRQELWAADM
ncbi:MAG: polysaccharide biosynthesis protein GumH, partial [Rhodoferax sp.]|nr:polysaccharide biosynthesis protein GumH [Rhodoferax sp.]